MRRVEAIADLDIDHDELYAVTEDALHRFRTQDVVERVSIVREYAELSELYPDITAYGQKLIQAVLSLAWSVHCQGDSILADRLRTVVH
jgi:hypothetical protein